MCVLLEDLGQAVKRLQHRHHRTVDARLVQRDALRAISRHPNASSHRLAQLTFQTDQSFGTLAVRLVARGLIDPPSPHACRGGAPEQGSYRGQ
jgi:hypothetical protein